MERDTNQMSQNGALCRSGCGFYGSPATDGLCSKCYKDALKRKQSTQPAATSASSHTPSQPGRCTTPTTSGPSTNGSESSQSTEEQLSTGSPTVPAATTPSLQDTTRKEEPLGTPETTSQNSSDSKGSSSSLDAASACQTDEDGSQAKGQKKKKNRCNICRKNVGLTGFECRCGGLFCSLHRYSNEHNCTFDYKELGAQEIRRNNPLVVGEKIQKI